MLRPVDGERWEALARPGRRCRAGTRVSVGAGAARVRIVAREGGRRARGGGRGAVGRGSSCSIATACRPCPRTSPDTTRPSPTIASDTRPSTRGTTARSPRPPPDCTSRRSSSRASAPSGPSVHFLTLHVGVGTFRPLRAERVEEHRIAAERRRDPRGDRRGGQSRPRRRAGASSPSEPRPRGPSSGRPRRTACTAGPRAPPISSSTPAIASGWSTPSSRTSTSRARRCCSSPPPSAGARRCSGPIATPSPRAIASTRTAMRC